MSDSPDPSCQDIEFRKFRAWAALEAWFEVGDVHAPLCAAIQQLVADLGYLFDSYPADEEWRPKGTFLELVIRAAAGPFGTVEPPLVELPLELRHRPGTA